MSSETWPQAEAPPDPLPPRRFFLTGVFVAVLAVGLLGAWALGAFTGDSADNQAADFTVTLFDDGVFSLSTHISEDGRPVVLNLWASWCAPCRAEIPAISAWSQTNPDTYVLGVAVEDVESSARELAAELQPSYDLAIGDDQFRADYPTRGLPATYFIDGEGRVTLIHNGILTEASLDEIVNG